MSGPRPIRYLGELTAPRDAEVIRVIRTNIEKRGRGTEADPVRRIEQFWSLDGELLAEVDPREREA